LLIFLTRTGKDQNGDIYLTIIKKPGSLTSFKEGMKCVFN